MMWKGCCFGLKPFEVLVDPVSEWNHSFSKQTQSRDGGGAMRAHHADNLLLEAVLKEVGVMAGMPPHNNVVRVSDRQSWVFNKKIPIILNKSPIKTIKNLTPFIFFKIHHFSKI